MAIGNQPNVAQINSQAAQIALQHRANAQAALQFQAYVVALGQAGLVALGFAAADATALLTQANYMATLAQIYQGTVQQGGTGGTGASLFNFQNALVALTGPS
jgi:hypothetical protein